MVQASDLQEKLLEQPNRFVSGLACFIDLSPSFASASQRKQLAPDGVRPAVIKCLGELLRNNVRREFPFSPTGKQCGCHQVPDLPLHFRHDAFEVLASQLFEDPVPNAMFDSLHMDLEKA